MGLNTAAIILNDCLHELEQSPDAGEQIAWAIRQGSRGDGRTHRGVTILPSQHADTVQIVAVGGNTIRSLGYGHWRDDDVALLKALAAQHGFNLVRKPAKASSQ
jgi:hypothetical protein